MCVPADDDETSGLGREGLTRTFGLARPVWLLRISLRALYSRRERVFILQEERFLIRQGRRRNVCASFLDLLRGQWFEGVAVLQERERES